MNVYGLEDFIDGDAPVFDEEFDDDLVYTNVDAAQPVYPYPVEPEKKERGRRGGARVRRGQAAQERKTAAGESEVAKKAALEAAEEILKNPQVRRKQLNVDNIASRLGKKRRAIRVRSDGEVFQKSTHRAVSGAESHVELSRRKEVLRRKERELAKQAAKSGVRSEATKRSELAPSKSELEKALSQLDYRTRLNKKYGIHAASVAGARGLSMRRQKRRYFRDLFYDENAFLQYANNKGKQLWMMRLVEDEIMGILRVALRDAVDGRMTTNPSWVDGFMMAHPRISKMKGGSWIDRLVTARESKLVKALQKMYKSERREGEIDFTGDVTGMPQRWLKFLRFANKLEFMMTNRVRDMEFELLREYEYERDVAKTTHRDKDARRRLSALRLLLLIAGIEANPGPDAARDASQPPSRPLSGALIRALLLRAGVEPNPGPPKAGGDKGPSKRKVKIVRVNKRNAAIAASAQDAVQRLKADMDAKREMARVAAETETDSSEAGSDVGAPQRSSCLGSPVDTPLPDPVVPVRNDTGERVFRVGFHGLFRGDDSTFDESDPFVTVEIFTSGVWRLHNCGAHASVRITDPELMVGLTSVSCSNKTIRMRNIYHGLVTSKAVSSLLNGLSYGERSEYLATMYLRAFLLTGVVSTTGKCKWSNNVSDWIVNRYTVEEPKDANLRLRGVQFSKNTLSFEARTGRNTRAAPFVVEGVYPEMPDPTDMPTLKAGLCKRLFPELPVRSDDVLLELRRLAEELADVIERDSDPITEDYVHNQFVEQALAGHPLHERVHMEEGVAQFMDTPDAAMVEYLSTPYKTFIKLESYQAGMNKPPRFIMSLPLKMRGIQVAAMASILHRVEHGTRICNVKGLTATEITEKLREKFENSGVVAETDFSSFESCIGPDLKDVVENYIFRRLARSDSERDFVDRCLMRRTVEVVGPCFRIPKFRHIRMSGDYWTSLGNLLENIILISFVTGRPVQQVMEEGLFEGDDGVFPPPDSLADMQRRVKLAGVLLTFELAPWQSLSFCGNHFEMVDGNPIRFRDPVRALSGLTVLYSPPRDTHTHDLMLQRAKVLSYLSGPIIKDTFVVAACIERVTRHCRVREDLLDRMGLLKEWSSYRAEGCVPSWLVYDEDGDPLDDEDFVMTVFYKNMQAGGQCSLQRVREIFEAAKSGMDGSGHIVLPSPMPPVSNRAFLLRDGLFHVRYSARGPLYTDVRGTDVIEKVPRHVRMDVGTKGRATDVKHSRSNVIALAVLLLVGVLLLGAAPYGLGLEREDGGGNPGFKSFFRYSFFAMAEDEPQNTVPILNLSGFPPHRVKPPERCDQLVYLYTAEEPAWQEPEDEVGKEPWLELDCKDLFAWMLEGWGIVASLGLVLMLRGGWARMTLLLLVIVALYPVYLITCDVYMHQFKFTVDDIPGYMELAYQYPFLVIVYLFVGAWLASVVRFVRGEEGWV